ncbi:DUF3618 domain-containing protein [Micromonospora endolithica]|uniref:DUF3618 domain-containing protein n=1 Tax=Micromonospora endolithica TaxID=230091 RepID=A0A3A9ZQ48_9ACTN|nr:DUF3618 domain-containing protein [Micromonospora endolithica]RKN49607.1 DUF3618 domain-containing protein [Micromonospora endolithica]TWJ23832.1 uncharacterized protein DUF3618 [Micromonospora endolithica]
MTSDPDQIRAEIEATRGDLSANVDALTHKASPRRAVTAPINQARGRIGRAVDKVMGTTRNARDTGMHQASAAAHQAGDALSSAGQQARALPQTSMRQTEGNPLAAGLIAFGAGLLASSLLPSSNTEQQVAGRLKQQAQAHSGQVKQQAADIAHQAQDNLRGPAHQATDAIRGTAARGVAEVRDESTQAARHLSEEARNSKNQM